MAGLGEVAIGIDFGHAVPQLAEQGFPVSGAYPAEGTGYEVGAIASLRTRPTLSSRSFSSTSSLARKGRNSVRKPAPTSSLRIRLPSRPMSRSHWTKRR